VADCPGPPASTTSTPSRGRSIEVRRLTSSEIRPGTCPEWSSGTLRRAQENPNWSHGLNFRGAAWVGAGAAARAIRQATEPIDLVLTRGSMRPVRAKRVAS